MSESDSIIQPGEYNAKVVALEEIGDDFIRVVAEITDGPHQGTCFLANIPTDHIQQGEYMSQQDKKEAQVHLGRARRQARHAAKNTAKAVQLGTEAAAEETKEVLTHAAGEVVDGVEHVAEEVKEHTPRLSARGMSIISSDLGVGFLATSVSIYSGLVAFHKFRQVFLERGMMTR